MSSRLLLTMALCWLMCGFLVHADETLQQQYLGIYIKIHEAEILEKKSDYAGALKGFHDCYNALKAIHDSDANWEPALVGHRMDDCRVTIERLEKELKLTANTSTPDATAPPAPPAGLALKTSTSPQNPKPVYPWKIGITATMFYIGEGSGAANAWNIKSTGGKDDPNDRNGFASGSHASSFNPFYVALPFNDLAFPDKAQQYVPAAWHREPKDGKPVSACQHRWVEIKMEDGSGHVCYGQWEDVGPSRNDHAEYVFGPERPDTGNRAGIDVSPAVASYLGFANIKSPIQVRWRFVEPEDVPPGQWMKLDEQAVIYTAMHQSPDVATTSAPAPSKPSSAPATLTPGATKP